MRTKAHKGRVAVYAVAAAIAMCLLVVLALLLPQRFLLSLTLQYGSPVALTWAPASSTISAEADSLTLIAADGRTVSISVADHEVFYQDGTKLDRSDIQPGDTFKLYSKNEEALSESIEASAEIDVAALVLISQGGEDAAEEAKAARVNNRESTLTIVYTPLSDDALAATQDGMRRSISCVTQEGEPAWADLPDLAIYDIDGNRMDVSDIQPGDTFAAFYSTVRETWPCQYAVYRLELVERGGQELANELIDAAWNY